MGIIKRMKTIFTGQGKDKYFIPFSKLSKATNEFAENNVIGRGGFGNVYLGILEDDTIVAVKRRKLGAEQGDKEFKMEIELLSNPVMKHPNLVRLIGHCNTDGEMILVYEYIDNGTLKSNLYGSDKAPLSWKQRLEVCVEAARGLNHLHNIPPNGIIHRDVKSDNILLDEKLCAKIADFGLAKAGPDPVLGETHVSTQVRGTFGYLDPEYLRTKHLTKKSDIHSFGVVLLEIMCGRKVIDMNLSEDKRSLVNWGKKMLEEEKVEEIVDEKILGTIQRHYLIMFGNIVLKCLADFPEERPTMEDVLEDLEWELKCVRATASTSSSATVAAAEDKSDHAVPSQGNGKALKRSGRVDKRTPGFGDLETIIE